MGIFNKLEGAGRTNIGLDGGLNTRIDPSSLTPPQTTTADNIWHVTNGQIRQLPGKDNNALASTATTYNAVATNGVEPFGSGGVLTLQDYPAIGVQLAGPNGVANQSTATASALQMDYSPLSLKTRVMGTPGVSDIAIDGKNQQFATPPGLAADATYRPYVLHTRSTTNNVSNVTTGDMVSQAQSGSFQFLSGSAYTSTMVGAFPGRTDVYFLAYINSGVLGYQVIPYGSSSGTAGTITGTNSGVKCFNIFFFNNTAYLIYTATATNAVYYVALSPTGASTAVVTLAGAVTTGTVQSISAMYCGSGTTANTGVLFAAIWDPNTATVYAFAQPAGSIGTGSNVSAVSVYGSAVPGVPAPQPAPYAAGRVTVGIAPAFYRNPVAPTAYTYAASIFIEAAFNYTGGPGTAYGMPASATVPQIISVPVGIVTGVGPTPIAATIYTLTAVTSSIQVPEGCHIAGSPLCMAGYDTNGAPYGSFSNSQILCPIVVQSTDTTSAGSAYGVGQYMLVDGNCKIVAKWNDAQGVGAYPTASMTNQFPPQTPILSPNDNSLVDWVVPYVTPGERRFQAAPLAPTVTNTNQVVYEGSGAFTYSAYYSALATFSMQRQGATCPPVSYGRNLVFGGATTYLYDGQVLHEANFWLAPRTTTIGTCTGTTGAVTTQAYSYLYTVIYRWVDAQGLVHRSRQGPPTQVIFGAPLSGTFSVNVGFTNVTQSYKFAGGSPVTATVYRSLANGSSLYAVGSVTLSQPVPNTYSLGQFYSQFQDTVSDAALFPVGSAVGTGTTPVSSTNSATQLDIAFFTLPADAYTGNVQLQYPPESPPSFVWQCTSAGRQYGLACVNGSWRVYFSQVWDEQHPPEWNTHAYIPCPPELGECRSIAAMDSYIVVFGVRGIGAFNGSGPARTGYPDFSYNYIYNTNFTAVTPLPVTAGARGTGAPVLVPQGLMYQDRQGMTLLDRSLNPTFTGIGDEVQELTGIGLGAGTIYGRGTLLESLQAVAWANPTGSALVYDYAQGKWSTWSAAANSSLILESQDRRMWALRGSISGSSLPSNSGGLNPLDIFTSASASYAYQVETPWFDMQPGDSSNTLSGTRMGEGDLIEMQIYGDYLSSHTLQIEIAVNYGGYQTNTQAPGSVTQFAVNAVPAQGYQFKVTPPGTTRAWAVRYRITVLPSSGNTSELARISGIVLLTTARSGTTRLSNAVSK